MYNSFDHPFIFPVSGLWQELFPDAINCQDSFPIYLLLCLSCPVNDTFEKAIFAKWESGWKITVASTPPTLKVLFRQIVFVPSVDITFDIFGIFQISILSSVHIVVFCTQSVFPQYLCLLKMCLRLPSETHICAVCYGSPVTNVTRNAWKWLTSCLTCPSSI